MRRFAGMTLPVANILIENVFCIVDDSTDDSQHIHIHALRQRRLWSQATQSLLPRLPAGGHLAQLPLQVAYLTAPLSLFILSLAMPLWTLSSTVTCLTACSLLHSIPYLERGMKGDKNGSSSRRRMAILFPYGRFQQPRGINADARVWV